MAAEDLACDLALAFLHAHHIDFALTQTLATAMVMHMHVTVQYVASRPTLPSLPSTILHKNHIPL